MRGRPILRKQKRYAPRAGAHSAKGATDARDATRKAGLCGEPTELNDNRSQQGVKTRPKIPIDFTNSAVSVFLGLWHAPIPRFSGVVTSAENAELVVRYLSHKPRN